MQLAGARPGRFFECVAQTLVRASTGMMGRALTLAQGGLSLLDEVMNVRVRGGPDGDVFGKAEPYQWELRCSGWMA